MSDCINWKGYRDKLGYGRVPKNKTGERFAHRIAWVKANGPIPDGMCVLHRCDNPTCINLDHLFLGTQRDNVLDMCAKRRNSVHHKLTSQQVSEMRSLRATGMSFPKLSARFSVAIATVWKITKRLNWKQVA